AGTSMGALIGGVYASGTLKEFKEWACNLEKRDMLSMVDFTVSRQGMVKGDKVLKKIGEFLPIERIEDLPIPYACVAAELIHKKEVVFTEGNLWEAIRASISIPTIFTPVKTEEGLLVDGGLMNNIPIDKVYRSKRDILIAVNVNADIPLDLPEISEEDEEKQSWFKEKIIDFQEQIKSLVPEHEERNMGYFNLITNTLELMTNRIDVLSLQNHKFDLLINISRDSAALYDFYNVKELVEIGRHAAKMSLENFK
nr:patatin-like phospholipase family protein [Bacteroidales bacterium]